jgi:hypothetical protein
MTIKLYPHQELAVSQLKTGSILSGGVGSGKSITAIFYYVNVECAGMTKPKDLYIITTAAKRDTLDWERECVMFSLSRDRHASIGGIKVTVDSWNNLHKYTKIKNAFFIFDEQRVIGHGAWVRSFIKVTDLNNWIILSATPGDTWLDYIPVFVANKFYKNRTEFILRHVVFNHYSKFPKVDHYVEEGRLLRLKKQITVSMPYKKATIPHIKNVLVKFDKELFDTVMIKRWNPYSNKPVKDVGELCHLMRKVVNSDPSRLDAVRDLIMKHRRIIVFYNFNYELMNLRTFLVNDYGIAVAEYNGHKHEPIPKTEMWLYFVQYTAGSEGWNCIEANTIVFYSQNYSYRVMTQAAGRIDRLNTPFENLYYYHLRSASVIDHAISKALTNKRNFNEKKFINL